MEIIIITKLTIDTRITILYARRACRLQAGIKKWQNKTTTSLSSKVNMNSRWFKTNLGFHLLEEA